MPRGGQGVVVVDLWAKTGRKAGKRWWFRVWHRAGRRWKSKSFADKAPGWTWAHTTQGKLAVGLATTGRSQLAEVGAAYVDELKRRRKSASHIRHVERTIKFAGEGGLKDIGGDVFGPRVREWLDGLTARATNDDGTVRRTERFNLAPSTKNQHLAHLRAIVNYAIALGMIAKDPLAAITPASLDKKAKPTFAMEELRRMLRDDADPFWLRFCVMIYTGCRSGEAVHLRWERIRWEERTVEIRMHPDYDLKRNRERDLPLLEELHRILFPIRKDTGWVFDNRDHRDLARMSWAFGQFIKRHGIERDRVTPHSTRHTWTALMLATDVNTLQVGAWAAHDSPATTKGYASAQGTYRRAVQGWQRGEFELLTGWACERAR